MTETTAREKRRALIGSVVPQEPQSPLPAIRLLKRLLPMHEQRIAQRLFEAGLVFWELAHENQNPYEEGTDLLRREVTVWIVEFSSRWEDGEDIGYILGAAAALRKVARYEYGGM